MSDQIVSITKPGNSTPVPQKQESPFPTEIINLPSKGWFYPEDNPLSTGQLELKVMTAKEEDILTSKNLIQKGVVLDKLLESLIVNKAIRADTMFNCDRNAAFVAIRRMAYGDEYKAMVSCPRCNAENEIVIDLDKLDNKVVDFSNYTKGKNEFDFRLPVSKRNITFKLLTKKDEDAIDAEMKALSKITKEVSGEITTRLKMVILSVDGNPERAVVRKFVDQEMTSRDSLAFRTHARDMTPDVDMSFDFRCSACGLERREDVPMGVSFFWPNE